MTERGVRARAALVSLLVLAAFGGLGYRLYAIQVRGHAAAVAIRGAQSSSRIVTEHPRGIIRDARGELLAVSVPVESVWADPALAGGEAAPLLAEALSMPVEQVRARLAPATRRFVWIRHDVDAAAAARVRALAKEFARLQRLPRAPFGVEVEFERRYPSGALAAHFLGMVHHRVASVWASPHAIPAQTARLLARTLGLRPEDVTGRLARADAQRVWIKRNVTEEEVRGVRRLADECAAGGTFGVETENDLGSGGVEQKLDALLDGPVVERTARVDGLRRLLEVRDEPRAGVVVTLTLIAEVQKIVEEELAAAVATHRPRWATAVVLDPRTGAVLALANWPGFDPADPGAHPALVNVAVSAPFEPGSQIKAFFAAGALDDGKARTDTSFECENGLWKYGPRILHDHHPYARLSLEDVIVKSSNIGAAKLGLFVLRKDGMHRWARAFGFGEPCGIDLPSESAGKVKELRNWIPFSTDVSFPIGQEIAVTEIQLAAAMAALANGGLLMRPYVVRRAALDDGTLLFENAPVVRRRVLKPATCETMRRILTRVVADGTGKEAAVPGIAAAGKTGTTQLMNRHGTLYGYISSFAGYAPAEDPRFVVAVAIGEPKGEAYYGGKVAAPVFRRIVERGLPLVE
ncbi:MAG: penicillin-binding protein 2 [Planctomycetes bacterium]|nr:penicillin-binding protein 2 [Planctomycetota bacterium]